MEKWFFPRQGSYFALPVCWPLQVFFPVVVAASCVYDFHCEIEAILKCFNNCLKECMNVQSHLYLAGSLSPPLWCFQDTNFIEQ